MTLEHFFKANQTPMQATLKTRTLVRMNKKAKDANKTPNPFWGRVYKISTVVVDVNRDYESEVNKQRAIEAKPQDFTKASLVWGKHESKALLINTDANGVVSKYLQTIVVGYKGSGTYVLDNGTGKEDTAINFADFAMFMPEKKEDTAKRQHVEDTVVVRSFKFESILELVIRDPLVIKLVP